eukprot:8640478-Ditylum_brightwellii.AAC.1
MERSKQNMCVDGNKDNGVGNSDDSGDQHITHLSLVVDCHLMEKSKQNMCVDGNKDDGVSNNVDNSDDGANKHPIHLS